MHPQDLFLKLFVVDEISDTYTRNLIEEHIQICRVCGEKAAEYADQNVENKLNVKELDHSVLLTKEEITGLLKWRESPKVLNEVKINDAIEDTLRKPFKLK